MADNTTAGTVAVLGTGIMGAPMARNLRRAGYSVRAYNRTRSKAEAIADGDAGVAVANTPAEAAAGAEFVITMVSTGSACEQIMSPPDGGLAGMSDDSLWLQMSTVGVAATERLIAMATDSGVELVDAPVFGTKEPAESAQLVVLGSGPRDALVRSQPVFDALARRVLWLGDAGVGQRLKLVLNNWIISLVEALSETLALAESIGVEPQRFLDTIKDEAVDVAYAHLKGSAMIGDNMAPSFPLRLAHKDAELVLEQAKAQDLDLTVTRAATSKFAQAIEQGHADDDLAATYYATARRG